jgi:hypothetical protein
MRDSKKMMMQRWKARWAKRQQRRHWERNGPERRRPTKQQQQEKRKRKMQRKEKKQLHQQPQAVQNQRQRIVRHSSIAAHMCACSACMREQLIWPSWLVWAEDGCSGRSHE